MAGGSVEFREMTGSRTRAGGAAEGLSSATLTALKWSYIGTTAKATSQLVVGILLGRLLGPEPFGLVAIAYLVIGFGVIIADCGFGSALVQKSEISERDVRSVFTLQLLLGVIFALLLAGLAGPISAFFEDPKLAPVLRVFSIFFITQSLGVTSASLLKREFQFRRIQAAQVWSYLVGYVLFGIPMALGGWGVWSLVLAQLVQSLLSTLIMYHRARHSIAPSFSLHSQGIHLFGAKVLATNLTNHAIGMLEGLFITRSFGAISFGLYNRSSLLITSVTNQVTPPLQSVLFPMYSRAQERSPSSLKRAYLTSIEAVALLMFPVGLSAAAVAPTVIAGTYGPSWRSAVPLLYPLALGMPFNAMMSLNGPLMWGKGKVERELKIQLVVAVVLLAVMSVTSRVSLEAIVWGVAVVYIVRCLLMMHRAADMVQARWRDILCSLRGAAFASAATVGATFIADLCLRFAGIAPELRLIGTLIAGSSALALIVFAVPHWALSPELRVIIEQVSGNLRSRLRFFAVDRTQSGRLS